MILNASLAGFDRLSLKVKYLVDAARFGLKAGVADAATQVELTAKELVPVKTGKLRESIHVEQVVDEPERQVVAVVPAYQAGNEYGIDPEYARRIEFGFVGTDRLGREYHQAPQPFMRPAGDQHAAAAVATIRESVRDEMAAASAGVAARRARS